MNFDESSADVTACEECPELVNCRSQIVNGVGPLTADVLLVGEAPGENEDREGRPFIGQSGDVLTRTLGKHGLPRSEVRITNIVRCRPPNNRDPTPTEQSNCLNHLKQEISIVDPELIITLGKVPSEILLDESESITSIAGDVVTRQINAVEHYVLPSVHPAATMYDPSQASVFENTIEYAAEFVGRGDAGQSSLDSF